MAQGINYPILLNPPKKVDISYERFKKLSYMGLASIFCSYKLLIGKTENEYILYMNEGTEQSFCHNKRFDDLQKCWFINSSAELVYCKIPLNHPLIDIINRKFSHLIME